jgi:subtilisin family serine protease
MGTEADPTAAVPSLDVARTTVKLLVRRGAEEEMASWVADLGGEVVSSGSRVLVATLPVSNLRELAGVEALERAEAPRTLNLSLDKARGAATGLEAAAQQFGSLLGEGVVVGIVDTGVDWSHPDFREQDAGGPGTTRLEYFGHYFRPAGQQLSTYDDFDADAINDALNGQGNVPQGDPGGHGTHVASIAAGNGAALNGQFAGVAPGATIMGVRSEPLLDAHIIRGIRQIFARAGDRPAVVNLSLGGHIGPHDGTSAIETVIQEESGPGRIVLVAAGNEGSDGIHWRGDLVQGQETVIPFRAVDTNLQFVDVWIPRGDEVDITIETPDGQQTDPDGNVVQTPFGAYRAAFNEDPVNGDGNLRLMLISAGDAVWRIRLQAVQVVHGDVHAWTHLTSARTSGLFPGVTDPNFSVGMPGTEERAITVASFVSRNTFDTAGGPVTGSGITVGQLSSFSSRGPTRIGSQKPDIAGPGQFVTAALSSNSDFETNLDLIPRHDASGNYITIQGTSMSTPFVAGVVALLLEREPGLGPADIKQLMRVSAVRDQATGRVWNSGYGSGKLDVLRLLQVLTAP